ncbi:unnamed protein product [Chrysoparadoxa australica]
MELAFLEQVMDTVINLPKPITMHEDNTGAMNLATNWSSGRRTKHILRKYHYVREQIDHGHLKLQYIKSEDQPADIMTKNLPRSTYVKHRNNIMG